MRRVLVVALRRNFFLMWLAIFLPSAVIFLSMLTSTVGVAEGKYFPVIRNFHITKRSLADNGLMAVDVSFSKVRDCQYADMNWSVKLANGFWLEVPVIFPEDSGYPPRSREVGDWTAHWVIGVTAPYLRAPLKVVVYHECWGPLLWTTQTIELAGTEGIE